MSVYELKDNRMLCWDEFFMDKSEKVEVKMHYPKKREKVLTCDEQWEGNVCTYSRLIKVGDKYRLYYRAANMVCHGEGGATLNKDGARFCLAESLDCKSFKRVYLNKYTYDGIKTNNIFHDERRDNFAIFFDENPACPESEKWKALSMGGGQGYPQDGGPHGLYMFVSEDGINFTLKGRLPLPGSFDSYNIMFWDKETEQYYFFYRGEHRTDGGDIDFDVVKKERTIFREIRMSTSKDLVNFEHHGELNYGEDIIPMQFYTNNIVKYHRAKDMFIGFPMRYNDRWADEGTREQMPLAERREFMTRIWNREGTALTDCGIMTSRDGYHFDRHEDQAFMTPGIENRNNWWYGNNNLCYGMVETPADEDGAPNEISFISGDNYRIKDIEYYRYTVRLDGFFSWYAKQKGGEILTIPFTFKGSELEMNYGATAFGGIVVTVCDEDGNEIEGYKSSCYFGDSVDRKIAFEKPLKDLEGKPVRLKINLKDCDLYSFKFN